MRPRRECQGGAAYMVGGHGLRVCGTARGQPHVLLLLLHQLPCQATKEACLGAQAGLEAGVRRAGGWAAGG